MDDKQNKLQDVPEQIFNGFLKELEKTDVSADVIGRLKTSIDGDALSETDMKNAMFSNSEEI